ncbi:helix-turn-helix transcriptional regulator [Legionella maioricensis]|uniref:LuxR C-terminal-related transcriptional regulator n=1 Tax=Legionella maioricensis TaxID=2896528 RepID=A0A9X2CXH5_9GAMM|nr:LuxR C-terminal-related transcriptional regulator [Legionella maioricensis]MCL9682562.1 LuxR C-terminal-related transcriptional regulator [Legionella maioricensis]MCL9686191.1 LuxR C-terminal-related transcriptional regulator [Legionella maioricensis]
MKAFNNMQMYTSYLENRYQPIFANTLIYSWGYFYYDLSGRCMQLMSDKVLLDVFLKNDLFVPQIINNITSNQDDFYASDIKNDAMLSASIKETLVDHQYVYFFDIVHNHKDYTEIYTFATCSDAAQSNNFVLNNIDVLRIVSQDLGERCRRLTKENTLILPKDFIIEMNTLAQSQQPSKSLNLKEIILEKKDKAHKLQEMVNDTAFDLNKLPFNFLSAKELTLKEKEIIYLYYFGFNTHRIADILEISKRTVDKHFENIKRKLACESTGQIIPTLLRSNLSINNLIHTV